MAGEKLQVSIGADISDLKSGINDAVIQLEKLRQQKVKDLKLGLDVTALNSQISQAKEKLSSFQSAISTTGGTMQTFQKKTADGGAALTSFSRIAQDAPYGIIGVGNNITNTAEQFGALVKQTGSAGGALKALLSSLAGVGGILLGVSLLTTGLTLMAQSGLSVNDVINKLTGNTSLYSEALKKANEEALKDSGVVNATKNVQQLTTEIELAKKGFLNKDKVVEHYNETIGKTTGIVKSIDEAEQALIKNGPDYIKMTLYKATATLAQEEAAKELLKSQNIANQKTTNYAGVLEYLKATFSGLSFNNALFIESLKTQSKELDKSEKSMKANLSIAEKFNKMAAEIAKQKGFNFFDDNKVPKAKKIYNTPQVTGIKSNILPAPLFDTNKIKVFNGQVDEFGNKLKSLPTTFAGTFTEIKKITGRGFTDLELASIDFVNNFNKIVADLAQSGLANLGTSIGEALATGNDVLQAVGQSLLQTFSSFLSQLGDQLIKLGLAAILTGDVLKSIGTISGVGAGIAAIAGGVALKAIAGGINASSRGGIGGGGVASRGGSNTSYSSSSSGYAGNGLSGNVVFEISGQKLIGVLNNTLNSNKRLGGAVGLG